MVNGGWWSVYFLGGKGVCRCAQNLSWRSIHSSVDRSSTMENNRTVLGANMIQRRSHSHFDSIQIAYRAEELIGAASNRYKITVQVANRAKKRHRYESDNIDDPSIKPVMRAIIEMSDELTQPEILGD
jgi:DNA-directed RNA polymerase subunit omega